MNDDEIILFSSLEEILLFNTYVYNKPQLQQNYSLNTTLKAFYNTTNSETKENELYVRTDFATTFKIVKKSEITAELDYVIKFIDYFEDDINQPIILDVAKNYHTMILDNINTIIVTKPTVIDKLGKFTEKGGSVLGYCLDLKVSDLSTFEYKYLAEDYYTYELFDLITDENSKDVIDTELGK